MFSKKWLLSFLFFNVLSLTLKADPTLIFVDVLGNAFFGDMAVMAIEAGVEGTVVSGGSAAGAVGAFPIVVGTIAVFPAAVGVGELIPGAPAQGPGDVSTRTGTERLMKTLLVDTSRPRTDIDCHKACWEFAMKYCGQLDTRQDPSAESRSCVHEAYGRCLKEEACK